MGSQTEEPVLDGREAISGIALVVALAGLMGAQADAPGNGTDSLNPHPDHPVRVREVAALADQIIIERDQAVTVRDGTRLSANVFRPKASGRFPIVMAFTAYDKDKGPDEYPEILEFGLRDDFDLGQFFVSPWTTWEAPDPAFWVPLGYAVVYVDARGYASSGGKPSVLSVQDGQDFFDAIEWAGTRDWSNGNVGLNGVSYLAISQWVAASANPPHLKAIVPWEGQSDSFREVLYHGGIPETAFTRFWLEKLRSGARSSPVPPAFVFEFVHKRPRWFKFLQGLLQDPSGIDLPRIEVPALICGSWSDHGLHTRGSFEGFKTISTDQKWLFTHGRPKWSTYYSEEALSAQKDFFDHFLKGMDNGMADRRPVRLEIRESLNTYQVRNEDGWPLARTEYRALHLDAGTGALARNPPPAAGATSYDPLTGSADFHLTFDRDTELSGNMKLKLWVSTSDGDDMDLFIGVRKFDAHGEEVHFYAKTGYTKGPAAMGWLRVSQRGLDPERSQPWQPVLAHERAQFIGENETVPVEVEILPSSTLFRAGERLTLTIKGRDLFEHPTLAHGHVVNRGTHTIYTGGEHDSHLLVPVIP